MPKSKKQNQNKKKIKVNWTRIIALILCVLTFLSVFAGIITYNMF